MGRGITKSYQEAVRRMSDHELAAQLKDLGAGPKARLLQGEMAARVDADGAAKHPELSLAAYDFIARMIQPR